MARTRQMELVVLKPEVAKPGHHVYVSTSVPGEYQQIDSLLAQLLDAKGEVVAESHLVPFHHGAHGDLRVPPTASDGFYEVVVASKLIGRLTSTLMVLSERTVKLLRKTRMAEQKKDEAYKLAATNQLALAVKRLQKAEDLYAGSGWVTRQAETILERAHLLGRVGCHTEQKEALREAMLKFYQAGLQSRENRAYVDARLHFEKAVALATQLQDAKNETINRNNLGEVLLHLRSVSEAQENLGAALRGAQILGDKSREARVRKNLGTAYVLQHQFDDALQEWNEAANLFSQTEEHQNAEDVRKLASELRTSLANRMVPAIHIAPVPVCSDPAEVVHRVVEGLEGLAGTRQIILKAELASDLSPIGVDPDHLWQDVYNAVIDVLNGTPAGGSVSVTARVEFIGGRSGITLAVARTVYGTNAEPLPKVTEVKRIRFLAC